MSAKYRHNFFSIIVFNIITGFPIPSLINRPAWQQLLVYIYCGMLTLFFMLIVNLLIMQVLRTDSANTLENLIMDCIVIFTFSQYLFNNIYYSSMNIKNFDQMIEKFDRITDQCLHDPLDVDKKFAILLKSDQVFIKRYSIVGLYMIFACSLFVAPIFFRSQAWFGLDGKRVLPFEIWTPFDNLQSPCYEGILFLELLIVVMASMKKNANDCILLSLMRLQKSFYRHLRTTMQEVMQPDWRSQINDCCCEQILENVNEINSRSKSNVENKNKLLSAFSLMEEFPNKNSSDPCEGKLKRWIKLHQEVISLGNDMVYLLDPIVTSFLLTTLAILTCSAFSVIQDLQDILQIVSLLSYFSNTLLSLFLLCLVGNDLTVESQRVADQGYWSPWYNQSKRVKHLLITICERAKIPLIMRAFRTTDFNFSNTTFIVFIRSIVSFYLALVQFKTKSIHQDSSN